MDTVVNCDRHGNILSSALQTSTAGGLDDGGLVVPSCTLHLYLQRLTARYRKKNMFTAHQEAQITVTMRESECGLFPFTPPHIPAMYTRSCSNAVDSSSVWLSLLAGLHLSSCDSRCNNYKHGFLEALLPLWYHNRDCDGPCPINK